MKLSGGRGEKKRLVLFLLIILLFSLLSNYFSRQSYDRLDRNMSSIYQDRLMPSSYLFRLNDHLYQKKLLLQDLSDQPAITAALDSHNHDINGIIEAYSATYLTANEEEYWTDFKSSLEKYNRAENDILAASGNNADADRMLNAGFIQALSSLNQLNELQAAEGLKLQDDSRSLLQSTVLRAYLEVSLLFILGIVALWMLTSYERVVYPAMGGSLLN